MGKFITPLHASVQKVSSVGLTLSTNLFPFGQLYLHTPTKTHFRLLTMGNRWDRTFCINTEKGLLVGKQINGTIQYDFEFPAVSSVVTKQTKEEILEIFLKVIS